jgi:acyl-CoA synthetase (AMP-forming)/AMP-acid ligase II
MLYECWQRIAREFRDQLALREIGARRSWTFGELAEAADAVERALAPPGPWHHPIGSGADFVLQTLAAWRAGGIVCPLEPGGSVPTPALAASVSSGDLPDSIVHLKLTSATTGTPRLVAFTAEQLAADAAQIVSTMGLRAAWPNLGTISLAHSYGFSNLILPLLLHGIPLILLDGPWPESVRRTIAEVGDVTLPAVPALWKTWHEAGVLSSGVRLAISAGAPLPVQLEHAVFERSGLKIHNFYGATECGGIAYDRSSVPRTDDACIGAPLDGVALAVGPSGCLEVRGAAVGAGYRPEPETGTSSLRDACFFSSDLAEIKGELVYLRGRAGDQINVAGRKVSPEIIERELRASDEVEDCLVFGVPGGDADRGDLLVACVVAKRPANSNSNSKVNVKAVEGLLKQFLLVRLAAWQVPREWHFVDSLEPNQRGKLSRPQWRARLGYR